MGGVAIGKLTMFPLSVMAQSTDDVTPVGCSGMKARQRGTEGR
jgi:hypothetical protein